MSIADAPPLLLGPADEAAPSLRAKRARALAALARARVMNFASRLTAGAVVALAAVWLLGNTLPLIWLVGLVAVALADRTFYRGLARQAEANEAPEKLDSLIAWTGAQSIYGNMVAPFLWFAPYVHGETLAAIYIIGGIANAAASLRAFTPLALAGAVPSVLCLLGLPIAEFLIGGGRNLYDLTPLIAGLLFLGFGVRLWGSLVESDAAHARAEASAMRERQAAAAAAAAKSDTIRRMRDELRTPMAALGGAAEHLRRAATTPEARRHIAMLVEAGDVLRLVLDDLSDLDRIENGQLRIEPTPTDPRELARGVAAAFGAAAHDKGLELFLDLAPDTPARVEIDAPRVRQVLFNLIANGVRYTTHGGVRVELRWRAGASPDRVRLAFVVSDTGEGLSRSQLAVVLGHGRSFGDGPGRGLGLSISSRLARLMGGRISAQSELGQGSMFALELEVPLAKVDAGLKGRSAA